MIKIIKISFFTLAAGWMLSGLVWPQEKVIEIAQSEEQSSPSEPPRTLFALVGESLNKEDEPLKNIPLRVGSKSISYTENRMQRNGDKITISKKKFSEPEKEIALKLLHLDTGAVAIVKIVKRGTQLISPANYVIEVVERPSGIRWNKWNTQFKVVQPANMLVIKNKYPEVDYKTVSRRVKNKAGQWQTIREKKWFIEKEIIYAPYSDKMHLPEFVEEGRQYIKNVVAEARAKLTANKVPSKVMPGKLVTEVAALSPRFFERLPLLEQTDFGEFLFESLTYENQKVKDESQRVKVFERVQVILGLNQEVAWANTCSKADACGWVQFTPPTYKNIRKFYPEAQLNSDFEKGAADHLNSMMAAILLYDYNLRGLIDHHGDKILHDPRLGEYLAAGYNGRPTTAFSSLKAAISKNFPDWTSKLKDETKGFIAKYRYLEKNNLP